MKTTHANTCAMIDNWLGQAEKLGMFSGYARITRGVKAYKYSYRVDIVLDGTHEVVSSEYYGLGFQGAFTPAEAWERANTAFQSLYAARTLGGSVHIENL